MKRAALFLATAYFTVMAITITFPGIRPFNNISPFVFGIPFVFAWVLSWVAGATVVFYLLYRAYHK